MNIQPKSPAPTVNIQTEIMVNLIERLRAEQCLIKSLVIDLNARVGTLARYIEEQEHAQKNLARDMGTQVGGVFHAGAALDARSNRSRTGASKHG